MANEYYICPFCAYRGKLIEYKIKSMNYTGKTFQCPDCNQIMRRNTLLREITPKEWGMWLYASIRVWNKSGEKFYDRIKKNPNGSFVFADRIKVFGEEFTNDFWEGWHDAKLMDMSKLKYIVDNTYIPDKVQTKLVKVKRIEN